MKFCKDCQHYLAKRMECEINPSQSWVTGEQIYTNAHLYRESNAHCGRDARWFEPITEDADLDDLSTIPFGK